MELRSLGDGGPQVSVVGLGCNNFGGRIDLEATRAVVDVAIDSGITLFDTADMYGGTNSEVFLGQALGSRRADVVLATKFGILMEDRPTDRVGSREYIRWAVTGSLKRLGTDYIDLYQLHRPDLETPIEETLGAMGELVTEGLVRHIGCSNFTGPMLTEADDVARKLGGTRFVSVQNHYSLLFREFETDAGPVALDRGIGVLPYFPLANGLLTGKYRKGEPLPEGTRLANSPQTVEHFAQDAQLDAMERLRVVADGAGVTLLHLGIGGLAAQPSVSSVIAGATKPEQVRANVEAGSWAPSADVLKAIDGAAPPPA